MATTSTTAISASELDPTTTRWTVAMLQILVEALAGATVAITTDRRIGFGYSGVRLVGVRDSITRPAQLLVEAELEDGTRQTLAYLIHDIGNTITQLEGRSVRAAVWAAMEDRRRVTVG